MVIHTCGPVVGFLELINGESGDPLLIPASIITRESQSILH